MKRESKRISIKQERFCQYYVESGGKATESYQRAYNCKSSTTKTISENACRLLKKSNVIARIKEIQKELNKNSDITKEESIQTLSHIVRTNPSNLFDSEKGIYLIKDLNDIPKNVQDAIQSIECTKNGFKVKLYSKIDAIDRLSKMLGWDSPVKSENINKVTLITGDDE